MNILKYRFLFYISTQQRYIKKKKKNFENCALLATSPIPLPAVKQLQELSQIILHNTEFCNSWS